MEWEGSVLVLFTEFFGGGTAVWVICTARGRLSVFLRVGGGEGGGAVNQDLQLARADVVQAQLTLTSFEQQAADVRCGHRVGECR